MNDYENGVFVSGSISAQNNVLWPAWTFCVDVLNCVRDFSCWLCIKMLKYGTEFIKDVWWGRSPKIEMKFVNTCSLTLSLSKSTYNKLWYIVRFCVNPLMPSIRYTHDTVWCSKLNVRYKWQSFNGLPYSAPSTFWPSACHTRHLVPLPEG